MNQRFVEIAHGLYTYAMSIITPTDQSQVVRLTKAALLNFLPCSDACQFISQHKTLKSMWLKCERPDWMIWALSKFGLWKERTARQFAVACAEHVLHFYEEKYPSDDRLRKAIEAGRACIDNPSAARSAAGSAARSAAWSAAWSAARSAAWSAAESAARSAAASAAWSAAWSAAESAAWSAAWSAAESAAWSAAASAAESAARSAARSAAGSAENKWQANKLRELIDPFRK